MKATANRTHLVVSLLVALVAGSFCPANTAIEPASRDENWLKRHGELVEVARKGGAEVVFLGDSITALWDSPAPQGGRAVWGEHFASLKAVNLGISGDRTQHILWRIQNGALEGVQPKVVVVLIGTNNTGMERDRPVPRNTVEEAVAGIKAVVKALTTKLPNAKILLMGLFPRGAKPDDPQRLQIEEINAQIASLHDGKQVFFWSLGKRFLNPDGTLSNGIMPDYLHLNGAGYQIWADAIEHPLKMLLAGKNIGAGFLEGSTNAVQTIRVDGSTVGPRFDGIGVVSGGGATAVLLKDYPEPQRSEILDLVYKPKFGASVSSLLVEIPGDGNSTQGSMPSHMRTADDLNFHRGYMWWILREAKKRNPQLTLDAAAWSAPGWIGKDPARRVAGIGGDAAFWSLDAVDYYMSWLKGLRNEYGLELDAIGCRNEKGVSLEFAHQLRAALNRNGFEKVKLHAFDNWPSDKLDFAPEMYREAKYRDAIDVISAHVFWERTPASREVRRMAEEMGKPIWNTEDHVYLKGFDCAISIVQSFNHSFLHSGATKTVLWYDIAGVYPVEPYSEDPSMILARSPWSGHYEIREALWGYAHYGQFSEAGWQYLSGEGSGQLAGGGSYVTLKSPNADYSIIIETKEARALQQVRFRIGGGLRETALCVWRSNANEQFVQQSEIRVLDGEFNLTLDPGSIYSISTTRGQQKGAFKDIPRSRPFPFPYRDTFDEYQSPSAHGFLPRYTADIADVFEIATRPDGKGQCIRQVVPVPTISWAPDWRPYTILGDEAWRDYEVSVEVWLTPGDCAGVMGRINHVGTGYGFIPKGYYFEVRDDGQCRLVVARGKPDKRKAVGDAEQQALIKSGVDDGVGGERTLAETKLSTIRPNQWHRLAIRFEGSRITGWVDGRQVVGADDSLYNAGMAGLLAGAGDKLSRPYFDDLQIKTPGSPAPSTPGTPEGWKPIYAGH